MTERKQVAARFLHDVLGGGRFELLPELVTNEYADRSLPSGVTPRMAIESFRGGFPDAEVRIDSQVEEGDRVITRWTVHASHSGDFFGIAPTGRTIEMEGFSEYRFEGDRMAEGWVTYDQLNLMQQLGAVPAPS